MPQVTRRESREENEVIREDTAGPRLSVGMWVVTVTVLVAVAGTVGGGVVCGAKVEALGTAQAATNAKVDEHTAAIIHHDDALKTLKESVDRVETSTKETNADVKKILERMSGVRNAKGVK